MSKKRREEIQEAFYAAAEAKTKYWSALSNLEEAIGLGDLDGLDELDFEQWDPDTIVAWAEEEEG